MMSIVVSVSELTLKAIERQSLLSLLIVRGEGFEEKLAAAVKDSTSSVAVNLKRNLLPLVQIAGHNLK